MRTLILSSFVHFLTFYSLFFGEAADGIPTSCSTSTESRIEAVFVLVLFTTSFANPARLEDLASLAVHTKMTFLSPSSLSSLCEQTI